MNFTRITSIAADNFLMNDLVSIYTEALVLAEQKPGFILQRMLENENYYFYVLTDESKTLGFAIIYSPNYSDYCLLEYMAIDNKYRNQGIGGDIFDRLSKIFDNKSMLIEIDSPYQESADQNIRKKRMQFYERHGGLYIEGLNYILPLECSGIVPEMLLLIKSNIYTRKLSKQKLQFWLTDIYTAVYGCKPDDTRLNVMLSILPEEAKLLNF